MERTRSPRIPAPTRRQIEAYCIRKSNRSTMRPGNAAAAAATCARTLRRTPAATAWPMACSDCGLTSTGVVSPKFPKPAAVRAFSFQRCSSEAERLVHTQDVAVSISATATTFGGNAGRPKPWRLPSRPRASGPMPGGHGPSPAAPSLAEPDAGVRQKPPARHAGHS